MAGYFNSLLGISAFVSKSLTTETINMKLLCVNNQDNKIVYKTDNVVIAKSIGFITHSYVW